MGTGFKAMIINHHLQVLIGQYAQSGIIGIWRAFPLARGIGLAWIIFIVADCFRGMMKMGKIMSYFIAVSFFFQSDL